MWRQEERENIQSPLLNYFSSRYFDVHKVLKFLGDFRKKNGREVNKVELSKPFPLIPSTTGRLNSQVSTIMYVNNARLRRCYIQVVR